MNAEYYIRQLKLYDILGYTNDIKIEILNEIIHDVIIHYKVNDNLCIVDKNDNGVGLIMYEQVTYYYTNGWKRLYDLSFFYTVKDIELFCSFVFKKYCNINKKLKLY